MRAGNASAALRGEPGRPSAPPFVCSDRNSHRSYLPLLRTGRRKLPGNCPDRHFWDSQDGRFQDGRGKVAASPAAPASAPPAFRPSAHSRRGTFPEAGAVGDIDRRVAVQQTAGLPSVWILARFAAATGTPCGLMFRPGTSDAGVTPQAVPRDGIRRPADRMHSSRAVPRRAVRAS